MTTPDVSVKPSSLLYQEKVWQDQGQAMGSLGSEITGSQYQGISGVFATAVDAYNAVCQSLGPICSQGDTEMNSIASTLKNAYDSYTENEQKLSNTAQHINGH